MGKILFILALALSFYETAPAAEGENSPVQLMEANRSAIYRLVLKEPDANGELASATAFAIEKSGYLLTGYLPISRAVLHPGAYQLFVEMEEGPVLAKIEKVDVINDICFIRVARETPSIVPLVGNVSVSPGQLVYSLGFDSDGKLGMAQGIFQGSKAVGLTSIFSSASHLGKGMEGGPTLDASGKLVGLNRVSEVGGEQFISPLSTLQKSGSQNGKGRLPASGGWKAEMISQIKAQEASAKSDPDRFSRYKTQEFAGYKFLVPLPDVKCEVKGELFRCENRSITKISSQIRALSLESVFSTASKGEEVFGAITEKLASLANDGRGLASLAAYAPSLGCEARRVKNRAGLVFIVRFCSSQLQEFPGLFNSFAKVEIEGDGNFRLAQTYNAFSLSAAAGLLEDTLDSVEKVK